jgi:hypothetical protein
MTYKKYNTHLIDKKLSEQEKETVAEIAEMLFHQRIEHGDYGDFDSSLSCRYDLIRAQQYFKLHIKQQRDKTTTGQLQINF